MISKAQGKFIRLSPLKVRQVIGLIRNLDCLSAQSILLNLNKRPKEYLIKLLKSAVANAKVKGFSVQQLYISKITCNDGPRWKRFKAAAFGRPSPIEKRTSHINLELDIKENKETSPDKVTKNSAGSRRRREGQLPVTGIATKKGK